MGVNQMVGDLNIPGNISCGSIKLPSGSVSDSAVSAGAAISAAKLIHVIAKDYTDTTGSAVVAGNKYAHIVNGATCTVFGLNGAVDTVATGADRTVSVDLQRSTGGGAFASILGSPLVFNNSSVARVKQSAALGVTTLVQGDVVKWVVTVAGAAGNQAIGLIAELILYEAAS